VYTSATLSLAALELLTHLGKKVEAPAGLVAVAAEIPDRTRVTRISLEDLPAGWRRAPAPPALADIGERWIREGAAAVLAVPSAIIPEETNYLLNPRHPAFATVRVRRPRPFALDPRLF
jgi:RES domain-containing protein